MTVTSGVPVLSAHVVVAHVVLADDDGARLLQLEPASHLGHEHAVRP